MYENQLLDCIDVIQEQSTQLKTNKTDDERSY